MNLRKRTREVFEGVNYMKENMNQYDILQKYEFLNE
jgi:hypothetical protein